MKEQIIKAARAGKTEELKRLIDEAIAQNNENTITLALFELASKIEQTPFDWVVSSLREGLQAELMANLIQYAAMQNAPRFEITTRINIANDPDLKTKVLATAATKFFLNERQDLAREVLQPLAGQNPERNNNNQVIDERTRALRGICEIFIQQNATPFLVVNAIDCFPEDLRDNSRLQFSQMCLDNNKREILKALINSIDDQLKKTIIKDLTIINANNGRQDNLDILGDIFPDEVYEASLSVVNQKNEENIEKDLKRSKQQAIQYAKNGQEEAFKGLIDGLQSKEHKNTVWTNTVGSFATKGNKQGLRTVLESITNNDLYVDVASNALAYAAQKGSDHVVGVLEVIDQIAASKKEKAFQVLKDRHGIDNENHPILERLDEKASENYEKITKKAKGKLKKRSSQNLEEGISKRNSGKNTASKASEDVVDMEKFIIADNADKKPKQESKKKEASQKVTSKKPSLG